jgi:hypothetical protein
MPMPKTDQWYVLRIHQYVATGLKAPTIHKRLVKDGEKAGRSDWPSLRTVHRYCDEYEKLPESVKAEQARFRWPETMRWGLLPWEASQAALELLALQHRYDQALTEKDPAIPPRGRPTVRDAKWFWRLSLAAPTLPRESALRLAKELAAIEYATELAKADHRDLSVNLEPWEWCLALRTWESREATAEWHAICADLGFDVERSLWGHTLASSTPTDLIPYFAHLWGDERAKSVIAKATSWGTSHPQYRTGEELDAAALLQRARDALEARSRDLEELIRQARDEPQESLSEKDYRQAAEAILEQLEKAGIQVQRPVSAGTDVF